MGPANANAHASSKRDAPCISNAPTTTQGNVSSGPRRRFKDKAGVGGSEKMERDPDDDYDRHDDPLLPVAEGRDGIEMRTSTRTSTTTADRSPNWTKGGGWMGLATASGACAAFNGVFAKLTTTELTTSISRSITRAVGAESAGNIIEFAVRCAFFGLNLIFNGVMWTLFTAALSRGTSTTQVSIINTSTNFIATAFLGLAIFAEALPPLWWLGATMLVVGNIIIGRGKASEDDTNCASRGVRDSGAQTSAPDAGLEERAEEGYRDLPEDERTNKDAEVVVPLVDLGDR